MWIRKSNGEIIDITTPQYLKHNGVYVYLFESNDKVYCIDINDSIELVCNDITQEFEKLTEQLNGYFDLYKAIEKIKEGNNNSAINFIERYINTLPKRYSKEEVFNLCEKAYNQGCTNTNKGVNCMIFEEWIKQNLK